MKPVFFTLLYVGFTVAACRKVKFLSGAEAKAESCGGLSGGTATLAPVSCAGGQLQANIAMGNKGQTGKVKIFNRATLDRVVGFWVAIGAGGERDIVAFLVKGGQTCEDTIPPRFTKFLNAVGTTNRALLENLGGPI